MIPMLKYTFILSLLVTTVNAMGQNVKLSPESEVSILTLGPDHDNLYSSFWHSAIRVKDTPNGIDWVYDYGRFDFDNPNFYTDFAKGYLRYKIGIASYKRFKAAYIYFNRDIEEQVLDLSSEQKQRVYDYLQWNIKPENQFYFYDYYKNNCATKIRDVFEEILGDSLVFDFSSFNDDNSFRSLTDSCLEYKPWGDYGIDLALGSNIDKTIEPRDYMFLPEFIRESFADARLVTKDGEKSIIKEYLLINTAYEEDVPVTFLTPHRVFWLFFVLVASLTFWQWKKNKKGRWLDILVFGIFGILGLCLAGIWFFTDHKAGSNNFNLLWAFPFHLLILPFMVTRSFKPLVKDYFFGYTILMILLMATWSFLPQNMHEANIPLVVALLVRSVFILDKERTK